jgi:7,8-dihydropterin-6-yl-methyl-4-(beta-D-ribofuranosyl)aminobenzene 5'-phosphate synthase
MTKDSFPKGVLPLDELEMLVIVDNETDTLSSVDEGVPQIPEVAHLAARMPPSGKYMGMTARLSSTSSVALATGSRCC